MREGEGRGSQSTDNDEADAMYDNVFSVVRDTEASVGELRQAAVSQRKAGRRMFCLFLVFIVVLAIVLLAVSLASSNDPTLNAVLTTFAGSVLA